MKNVGDRDSQVRWVTGFSLFVFSFFTGGSAHWFFLALGTALIATAYFHFCPIWFGFRVNTHASGMKIRRGR